MQLPAKPKQGVREVKKKIQNVLSVIIFQRNGDDKWVSVTTAWRVLGLRMKERPPDMEGSCEYIE
jgi:hypothetical protein